MLSVTLRWVPVAMLIATTGIGCTSIGEWYEIEAQRPVGARQKQLFGKLWPPFGRPMDRQQLPSHRYHNAHYWPHPYVCQDRAYVKEVSQIQVNNGWIATTTLYDYHFDPETNELTDSGRRYLRSILENAPIEHRLAWVQTDSDSQSSQQRLSSVRGAAAEMVGEANIPPIMLRVATTLGRPALEIDDIRRAEKESTPEPRVQYAPLPTGSGGD